MEERFLLGFALVHNIGSAKLRKIKKYFSSFEAAWKSFRVEDFINAGLLEKDACRIIKDKPGIKLEREYAALKAEGQVIISQDNPLFPSQLKEIPSPPFLLFCRGNTTLLKSKQISIVGTRKVTLYGQQVTEKLTTQLCQAGLTVTSGLAQGTDSLAHQTALECDGKTIAVLGSGIDEAMLQTSFNYKLAKDIITKSGLLVTEFPPHFPANKFTFPARNRIISGLSLGVLVVEAGEKSGTLITTEYALQQNREVFAVPGSIFSQQSSGTHKLIKQGAKVVTDVADILDALNFNVSLDVAPERRIEFKDVAEERIYKLITFQPIHIEEIVKATQLEPAEVSTKLSLMELSGLVKAVGGGRFIRS